MIVATDPGIGVCCTTAGGEVGGTGRGGIMIRGARCMYRARMET